MFGSQRGLGYLLMTAIGLQNIQVIMSVTLLLVLVAATVNTLLLAQDRRLRNPAIPSQSAVIADLCQGVAGMAATVTEGG